VTETRDACCNRQEGGRGKEQLLFLPSVPLMAISVSRSSMSSRSAPAIVTSQVHQPHGKSCQSFRL
jgi:hypothetical protein